MARRPNELEVTFREVTPARWPDFERLFEGRGGPAYCWCTAWRAKDAAARQTGPEGRAARKSAMKRRILAGERVGILGYREGEPIAWCSIAPRETYLELGGPAEPSEPGAVWSLACLFVVRALRGQGMTGRLIDAAIEQARARGARVLEAYPVEPDSPSYRYMGFLEPFLRRGFKEVGRAGSRRHVVRLDLEQPARGRRGRKTARRGAAKAPSQAARSRA